MEIQAVVVKGELPSGCGGCDYMTSREKGRGVVYECTFVTGFIVNKATYLPNCPLILEEDVTNWIISRPPAESE